MKKKIKINFADFWVGFNPTDNYFFNLLKENFDIEISKTPEYLFYSVFGNDHQNYRCKKILYIGENIAPPLCHVDYAFSFDYMDDKRNFRLPHYLLYPNYYDLINKKVDDSLLNRKFCSFVVSNGNSVDRNNFFQNLSKYKKIDSGGRIFNNLGYLVDDKHKFLKQYKFNLCFENNAHRGYNEHYTTEKLPQAMLANTIGIYFGNTQIEKEFNKNSFINVRDFKNYDEAIEYIIYLDKNDDKYMEVTKQPYIFENQVIKLEYIKEFLYSIFE